MSKSILIIGGGISGLSALHFLKKKYEGRGDVNITLFEKHEHAGGTVQTLRNDDCLFETGPNAFLYMKPKTKELIEDLNLSEHVVKANAASKNRYVSYKGKLVAFPSKPQDLFFFPLFNASDTLKILKEVFVKKGGSPEESVYDFGKRRMGEKFSKIFLDPMISGIYAGDSRRISLYAAFPQVAQMEEKYTSLFKAMIHLQKERRENPSDENQKTLYSFENGMGEIIETLAGKYQKYIKLKSEVASVGFDFQKKMYQVQTSDGVLESDEVYMCVPAYVAARLLKGMDKIFSQHLETIEYAPVCVVGLVYYKEFLSRIPDGFGYLNVSEEKREALGVLFESNTFPSRVPHDQFLFRVMLGGVRNPQILNKTKDQLIESAEDEVRRHFPLKGSPTHTFFQMWPLGIPQYALDYLALKEKISRSLQCWPKLHLAANYWGGVAFNDCIENAHLAAGASSQ